MTDNVLVKIMNKLGDSIFSDNEIDDVVAADAIINDESEATCKCF